jgi:LmbE family N-acetylglucosaminyl deacetylase
VTAAGRDVEISAASPASAVLSWIDRLPRARARRALVLGPDADRWAGLLEGRGFEVTALTDPAAFDRPPRSADLVLAVGALERAEWDRWLLQQAHAALDETGHLVLAAPGFFAVGSLRGFGFVCGRVLRELGLRLRRLLRRPPPRERFRGRRYRLGALIETLESLGYVVEHRSAHDFGWLAPLIRRVRRPERFAGTLVVACRRVSSLFGLDPSRPFPDPESHRRRFERTHRRFVEDRERWLASHPRYRPQRVRSLEPADFRGARVLVLAPHPDDELIGCGGTLARLIAAGARVTVVHATDGSEAASLWHAPERVRREVRLEEAKRVGEAMGFERLIFWRESNAAFAERPERVSELTRLLEELEPALVFTPFVTDIHPDHRVLNRMLAQALAAAPAAGRAARVLNYQVWSLVPPNLYCEIGEVAARQEQVLLLYATAMKVDDYVHYCQDRNYYDAVVVAGRPGFVEAFLEVAADELPVLVATVEGSDG